MKDNKSDSKIRCEWCLSSPEYVKYHDEEWGVPVYDDNKQFEFLVLESAQAGLSWITILKRREDYRKAYSNFDVKKVAGYDNNKIAKMLSDTSIIRNRLKIESSINNAKRFIEVQKEFGSFSKYIWGFVNNKPVINSWDSIKDVPANTELSDSISKDLKKRGFKFVGSTIIYSHLQATGIINDHVTGCFRHDEIKKLV